jgi:hypothetical protein
LTSLFLGIKTPSSFIMNGFGREAELFGFFGSVFGAALFTVLDAYGVQGATDDVIPDSRKVFYPSSSNENNGMLLEVMADPWNISRHLYSVG